jgi:hypothetical protein
MRMYALAAIVAAAALFPPVLAFSQGIEIGPGGVHIDPGRDREGRRGDCEELRRACLHKDELGEEGEGNCRRFRETCKNPD